MLGWLRRNILQPQKDRTAGRPSRIVRAKYDSAMTSAGWGTDEDYGGYDPEMDPDY